ncbi:MAG TPA: thermonuclease family protein [Actinomycetota bacterium]|nr:thermonuclease family protein [Actinomycetota bacterium]
MGRRVLLTVGLAALVLAAACAPVELEEPGLPPDTAGPGPTPAEQEPTPPTKALPSGPRIPRPRTRPRFDALGRVTHVVDGDTVDVLVEGEGEVRVRLIGVDAPESVHPSRPVECYAMAASRFVRERLLGARVGLEYDVERLDRYGRTLAYVWVGRRLFNEELLRQGYAQVFTVPPNVKYVDRFLAAQREARRAERGLWSACADEGASARGASGQEVTAGGSSGSCDPSYPDVCIPPPPPDLDCADVPFEDFRVEGPDPHGFDGDGDGVGCET